MTEFSLDFQFQIVFKLKPLSISQSVHPSLLSLVPPVCLYVCPSFKHFSKIAQIQVKKIQDSRKFTAIVVHIVVIIFSCKRQLYKSHPSLHPSIHLSICWSIRPSVHPSIGHPFLKNREFN